MLFSRILFSNLVWEVIFAHSQKQTVEQKSCTELIVYKNISLTKVKIWLLSFKTRWLLFTSEQKKQFLFPEIKLKPSNFSFSVSIIFKIISSEIKLKKQLPDSF